MPEALRPYVGRPVWSDDDAVRQQPTGVVEQQDTVAQETPTLLGMGRDGVRRLAVAGVSGRAGRLMSAGSTEGYVHHPTSVPPEKVRGPVIHKLSASLYRLETMLGGRFIRSTDAEPHRSGEPDPFRMRVGHRSRRPGEAAHGDPGTLGEVECEA